MRRAAAALTLVVAAGLTAGADAPSAAPLPSAPACPVFPAGNVWNQHISALPVASDSDTLIAKIGLDTGLHPDFGSYGGYGIPFNIVPGSQQKVKVRFDYSAQSDHVGYPIPAAADRGRQRPPHADRQQRHLQALRAVERAAHRRGWRAGSGAIWNMRRTRCGRTAGRAPTPPGCRSCPGWCATRRWRRA